MFLFKARCKPPASASAFSVWRLLFEFSVRGWGRGYPSLPSKMAPWGLNLCVSWPFGTEAIISVKCAWDSYCLHISSLSPGLFTSRIFLFSQPSPLSPLPSPPACSQLSSPSPSAMQPRCQSWLFWFERATCGWNLRPASLPSHRPGNGAPVQENKALFLAHSVDE